jgi:hypothetical protein
VSSFLRASEVRGVVELGTVSHRLREYSIGLQCEPGKLDDVLNSKRANVLWERARIWSWVSMSFVGIVTSYVSNFE